MLTDEQKKEIVLKVLTNLKKKVDNIDDKTEEKEGNITDPLKNVKAIIKYYGTHNRLK